MKTLESFQDHSSKMFQSDEQVFDHFRRWGYLTAQLDPLGQYLLPHRCVLAPQSRARASDPTVIGKASGRPTGCRGAV